MLPIPMKKIFCLFACTLFIALNGGTAWAKLNAEDQAIVDHSPDLKLLRDFLKQNNDYKFYKDFVIEVVNNKDTYIELNDKGRLQIISPRTRKPWVGSIESDRIIIDGQGHIIFLTVGGWKHSIHFFDHFKQLRALYLTAHRGRAADAPDLKIIGFKNLEELTLQSTNFKKVELALESKKLRYLSLDENPLVELKGLGNYPNIQWLNLNDIETITKVEGLHQLHELRWMNVSSCKKLQNLTDMRNLPKLEYLDMGATGIKELPNIGELKHLEFLSISKAPVCNTVLELPSSLRYLRMFSKSADAMASIPPSIAKMKDLEHLQITANVRKIEYLSGLKKLSELILVGNEITKIENLTDLPSLKRLVIGYNPITKIEGLESFTHLEELALNKTLITKVEGIGHMTIDSLDLSNTKISQISYTDEMKNVGYMDLSNCPIDEGYDYESFLGKKIRVRMFFTPFLTNLERAKNDDSKLERLYNKLLVNDKF